MNVKKEFQNTVGKIRKDWRSQRNTPKCEYPKAMMTSQQEANNTATVNCGAEWCSFSGELSDFVLNDDRFQKFLSDAGAEAAKEKIWRGSCPGYQIRIEFLR